MRRCFKGSRRVTPCDMTGLAQVAGAVDLWRAFRHRLRYTAYRLQDFILDLNQLFGLLQYFLRLRDHEADGIPHAAGDRSLCNHDIPVLLYMSHFIVRYILRCQYACDSGQSQCRRSINIKDPCSWIRGTHGRQIQHVVHDDVVRIFPVSEYLFPDINPERLLPDAKILTLLQLLIDLCFPAQDRCRELNCLDDFLIAGAAAEIAPDCLLNIFFGGVRIFVQQRLSRHHHTRRTETALDGASGSERVDKRFLLPVGEAFNRQD